MQAVILAAGRGTRMQELTSDVPKPLLQVHGRTLLQHKLDILPNEVTEVLIVVGYREERIRETLGERYQHLPIRYVTQEKLDGTGGALWCAKNELTDRFLVMMGDDLYAREDVEHCLAKTDWAMLVERTNSMAAGGCVLINDKEHIVGIREGDHRGTPGCMGTNLFVLDTRIFSYPLVPKNAGSDEYGLPQSVVAASLQSTIPFHAVEATRWIQITSPEDLTMAEERLARVET